MSKARYVMALIGSVGPAGMALADNIIASAPLFHPEQGIAYCEVFNAGASTVHIKSARIFKTNGTALPLNYTCGAELPRMKFCELGADLPNAGAHLCRIVTVESPANIRAIFTVRKSTYELRLSSELR